MEELKKLVGRRKTLELSVRLYIVFFVVSASLSVVGLILGILFRMPFWMNIPHIIVILMCLVMPLILNRPIKETTKWVMYFGAIIYIPFVFFTNGGINGAAPIYLVMIIVFFAFHFSGKGLVLFVAGLNIYYVFLVIMSYMYPAFVVPYPDETSHLIDLIVAVVAVSVVLVLVAYYAYNGYKEERERVLDLMDELKEQNKILEERSIRDQLTKIYTRRHCLDKLTEELVSSESGDYSFCVLMVDIDHFKKVNDNYGHQFGDEVLKKVANGLDENIRDIDMVARYGGEEFILILTHVGAELGYETAERLRIVIEELEFKNDIRVTVSIGLAVSEKNDTTDRIIDRADALLYKAKNSGRNRVCG